MSVLIRIFRWCYTQSLRFYPLEFRSQFGAEMLAVFTAGISEAQNSGVNRFWQFLWREFRDWPFSIWREHLQGRKKEMSINGFLSEKPLSPRELLAAMIIFVLPMVSIVLSGGISLPQWTNYVLLFVFWGCVIFAIGLAIVKKVPRWSLSYLGFLLIIGIIFSRYDRLWDWIYTAFIQSFGPRSMWALGIRIIYSGVFALIMVFTILVGALILVSLLRLIPFTRIIWQRIRADWTQLSFLLYGSLVFSVLLWFEEYRQDEIWKIAAWICLAMGAWFYLRATEQKPRMLALMGGATGAFWVIAIGTWVLIPLQDWPGRYSLISMQDLRWTDASSAIISWVGYLMILMAPALLDLLPPTSSPAGYTEENPLSA